MPDTLFQRIKSDQVSARKRKDKRRANILTTLLGEAAIIGKNDGGRESTDKEVLGVIQKFIKNINITLDHVSDDDLLFELDVLHSYQPTQLSEDELRLLISDYINANELSGMANMGKVMGWLSTTIGGQYDGSVASNIVREALL